MTSLVKVKNILMFSTADWDNPHQTNKQRMARIMERHGYKVLYVESLGLRRPQMRGRDFKRMAKRVASKLGGLRKVSDGVYVLSPLVVPLHQFSLATAINRRLLRTLVSNSLAKCGFDDYIYWTYNPISAEYFSPDGHFLVYHCVDKLSAAPGLNYAELINAERAMLKDAGVVFVTSRQLLSDIQGMNKNVFYHPNVCDFELCDKAPADEPADMKHIPRPRVGFVGALSEYKVDVELLCEFARSKPDCALVLIGEIGEGQPASGASRLLKYSNVFHLGSKRYTLVPQYIKNFDCALIPNVANDYTRCSFPMKFFEYLACRVPVVAINTPSLEEFCDAYLSCGSRADFPAAVETALKGVPAKVSRGYELARQYTWEARMKFVEDVLDKHCRC